MNRHKCFFLILLCAAICTSAGAQRKTFKYDFYGFVRGELYANSRQNTETVDGLFYLLPNDRLLDALGEDLNAVPNGSFYTLTTRLGMNMKGPNIGAAQSSAKIETDFGGSAEIPYVLRLRQAYVKLDWKNGSSFLLGQTWHPFFGDVAPQVLNLSTGAPFQPFNRSPMIQYQFAREGFKLKAAAVYQLIYLSTGPYGKSEMYQKNSLLPELCLGADYSIDGWLAGVGVEALSQKPRTQSTLYENTFRVDERITTISGEAHAGYADQKLYLAAKTLLTSNMNHTALLGGYGVSEIDPITGAQSYTPFRHSTTWVNAVYGNRWKGGAFAGFTKNLGSSAPLVAADRIYGLGMNLDKLATLSAEVSYQLPHWKLGVEYQISTGWYGEINLLNGKVEDTHSVTNNRIVALFMYQF